MGVLSNLVAGTSQTRSGDRVRNGMVIGGMSATGISILLDPYISAFMALESRRGITFSDPELWKDAIIQFAVVLAAAIWGTVQMWMIRRADNAVAGDPVADELRYADEELGRLKAQVAALQASARPES